MRTLEKGVVRERQVLACAIVTDDEDPISPVTPEPIVNEMQRPSLVRRRGHLVYRAAPKAKLAPNALADLECCGMVDPLDALVVVDEPIPTCQHDHAPLPTSPVIAGLLDQPASQRFVRLAA